MDTVLVVARAGLALIFIAAAVGKLLDAEGSRRALEEFRVPERWVRPGSRLLPIAELAIAGGLLVQPLARPAAAAAIVLLAAFVVGINQALRRGSAPDCHCFGQLHSAPAGRGTIVRNAVLVLPAALIVWRGPGDALAGRGAAAAALVAGGALVAALTVATFILVRENRRLRTGAAPAGPQPLPVGTPAPELQLRNGDGASIAIADVVVPDRPTALVFVAPDCGPCAPLLADVARWRPALAEQVEVVVVSTLPGSDGPEAAAVAKVPDAVWDVDNMAVGAYRLRASPAAVLVNPDGRIASSPVTGHEAIKALIRVARERHGARPLAAA